MTVNNSGTVLKLKFGNSGTVQKFGTSLQNQGSGVTVKFTR